MKSVSAFSKKLSETPLSTFGYTDESDKDKAIPSIANREQHPSLKYYPINPDHLIDRNLFRDFTSFVINPLGCVFTVIGPTGSGKSTGLRQILARLNWPLVEQTGSGCLEFRDLLGSIQLVIEDDKSVTRWQDGPLVTAMRHGAALIINEYDYIRPSELAALNDIIETGSVYIPATNELIEANESFRIIFTGNTNGYEDDTGAYVDTLKQNAAILDRRVITYLDYLTPEQELKLLLPLVAGSPQIHPILPKMIECANDIRKQFKDGKMQVTISTRKMVHWVLKTVVFSKAPNPLQYALNHVLLAGIPAEDAEIIDNAVNNLLGASYKPQVSATA